MCLYGGEPDKLSVSSVKAGWYLIGFFPWMKTETALSTWLNKILLSLFSKGIHFLFYHPFFSFVWHKSPVALFSDLFIIDKAYIVFFQFSLAVRFVIFAGQVLVLCLLLCIASFSAGAGEGHTSFYFQTKQNALIVFWNFLCIHFCYVVHFF